jgi:hypothetical protein
VLKVLQTLSEITVFCATGLKYSGLVDDTPPQPGERFLRSMKVHSHSFQRDKKLFQRDRGLRFEFGFHSKGSWRKICAVNQEPLGAEFDVHISRLEGPWATKDSAALILKRPSRYALAFAVSTLINRGRTTDVPPKSFREKAAGLR